MKYLQNGIIVLMVFFGMQECSAETITVDDIGANYEWGKYQTFDGKTLDLFVFRPQEWKEGDRRAATVCIHGGGWVSGRPDYFFPHCRYFSLRGAVAFSVGYRLVDARGIEAFDGVETCIADCKAALAHIRKNADRYGIDPDKIAVLGDSAGGHLAACLITMKEVGVPDGYNAEDTMANAAVCYNPCIDMRLPLVMKIFGVNGTEKGGETVYPADALIRADHVSPIRYVTSGLPPSLVMHGTADTTIPVKQARRFASAMKKAGNKCDPDILDGSKHAFVIVGLGTEETIVHALRVTDAFLSSLGFLTGEPLIEMK